MPAEYREELCSSALNRVRGMDFGWSLNPYTGCAHRCTFCYVRGFERRADRPWDDRYGRSIRVKINFADVLRAELARPSWRREEVLIGAATDPYQPAEGRYRLTRAAIELLGASRTPFGLICRRSLVLFGQFIGRPAPTGRRELAVVGGHHSGVARLLRGRRHPGIARGPAEDAVVHSHSRRTADPGGRGDHRHRRVAR